MEKWNGLTMPLTIERKIYFYKLEAKKDDQDVAFGPIFEFLNTLPFTEQGRYLLTDDENFRAIYIDSIGSPIRARIGTKRRNDLPMIEVNGTTHDLTMPEGGGLLEPSHFVIFPDNVIGCEFNFYGPRPVSIRKYLLEKAEDYIDEVIFTPIIRHDLNLLLSRMGEVRVFSFKAHRGMRDLIEEMNTSLANAFSALRDTSDAKYIEIVLRNNSHSRDPISLPLVSNLAHWLGDSSVRAGLEELKIHAFDESACEFRDFDLLKEYIHSVKTVVKHDDIHKSINSDSMYTAIISAYNELRPEIRNILEQ